MVPDCRHIKTSVGKETLGSLLIKEVKRRTEENQELSPDHNRQPDENKEDDQKGEGEGVSEREPG